MKRMIVAVVALIVTALSASNSDAFPLGVYSFLGNKQFVYLHKDSFVSWMDSLSYNVNIMELFPEGTQPDGQIVHSQTDFSGLLSQLDGQGIDAIIMDRCWKDALYEFSPYYLTKSNYIKLEAEVSDDSDVLNCPNNDDVFWYGSNYVHNSGTAIPYEPYEPSPRVGQLSQNQDAWDCFQDSHSAGYAYGDLQSRWGSNGIYNPLVGDLFRIQLPPPTQIYPVLPPNFTDSDAIYITYRIKIDGDSLASTGMPLLYFRIACYKRNTNGSAWDYSDIVVPSLVFGPGDSIITNGLLTDTYFSALPSEETDDYFDVTAKVTFEQLYNLGLITYNNGWTIPSLNPRLFWYDNCDFSLDYIEIEDSIHRKLRLADSPYIEGIVNRADILEGLGTNVSGVYTHDEPTQAQFDSYDLVQRYLYPSQINQMTAVNRRGSTIIKDGGARYNHYAVFDRLAQPKVYMPDPYPILGTLNWSKNDATESGHLQKELNSMVTDVYDFNRRLCDENELFYPVVQAFGRWLGSRWKKEFIRPPKETQTMLQYLPLCFGADGIFNYRLFGYHDQADSLKGDYCALSIDHQSNSLSTFSIPYIDHDTYDALKECNPRVRRYGEILNQVGVNWDMSGTLLDTGIVAVNPDYQPNLSEYLLDSIQLAAETSPNYKGYIQLGFYEEGVDSNYIMLVNRRSNYFVSSPIPDYPRSYSSADLVPPDDNFRYFFPGFPSQTVVFEPNTASHTSFGTHIALYDPYDNSIYQAQNDEINVEIGPGDGILLKMCSTLPSLVTNNADIKNIAYLSGSITIDQGAEVTMQPGTTTNIFANSTIRVKGGSTLNVSGTVEIADNVSIIVEDGSDIIFSNATCNWGINSILQVEDSGITATNTILQNTTSVEKWRGLRITNAGTVSMTSTTITGAESNEVTDSQMLLTDCRFNVPTNGMGLSIANTLSSQNVRITSTTEDKGFYSTGSNNMGLYYDNPNAGLFLNGLVFDGFFVGFGTGLSSAVGDTIQYCYFSNNTTGAHLIGLQYSPLIRNCTFFQNDLGAYFEVTSPRVMDCDFVSCDVGIRTELATATTGGIYNSNFSWGEIGVVSRGSNQRVSDNKFYTNTGILNHAGSILNMGNSAKNLFKTEHENLKFQDTASYTARVQLYGGHNDFYHKNPGPLNPSLDFHFDSNWYVSPPPRSNAVNANYNWFEDGIVKISSPGIPSQYAYCNFYDPSPNVFLENNDRMAQALSAELAGNYQTANDTYKTILNENEISESELLYDALDAYYRTADLAGETLSGTESYLLSKLSQYETDNPILTKYLQDYLVKNSLQAEAFQAAIDLLELRILNAESPVDSLHAVMNLEIVLQLAAMSESKKPISTKFTQYKYSDRDTFKAKHEEHWELLDELQNGIEDGLIPIPDKALISSNYPNPFNPSTTITYSIPKDGLVRIGIYNIKGQKVKDLCKSEMLRGHHKVLWDGKDAKQRSVSSGIYFVKLQASGVSSTRKIMLMN